MANTKYMKLSKGTQKWMTTVTPLSKFLALVAFITFPFVGFCLGMKYQKVIVDMDQQIELYKWDTYKDQSATPALLGKYVGTLPCEDCGGIDTELYLFIDNKTQAPRTFLLKERLQGRDTPAMESTGTWALLQGTKKDDEAMYYQLNIDGATTPVYYQQLDETSMKKLNNTLGEIKSKENYLLIRE